MGNVDALQDPYGGIPQQRKGARGKGPGGSVDWMGQYGMPNPMAGPQQYEQTYGFAPQPGTSLDLQRALAGMAVG